MTFLPEIKIYIHRQTDRHTHSTRLPSGVMEFPTAWVQSNDIFVLCGIHLGKSMSFKIIFVIVLIHNYVY